MKKDKTLRQEMLINKYQLRKENGCFDINKALMLESILERQVKTSFNELKLLQEMLK